MAQLYSQAREVLLKLVFYGPAGGGKTTTLTQLHKLLRPEVRGQIVSVNTGADRTLFFDFYPPPPPLLGAPVHAQVFAGSGTVQNESTRRALLAGCDGVLFVWDSVQGREADCAASLDEFRVCLGELGVRLQDVPLVIAWNKRDHAQAVALSDLEAALEGRRVQSVPMVAKTGQGVFEAFRLLATEALAAALRKRPELSQSGGIPRSDLSFGNDMVTVRRMLAAQEAESSLRGLLDTYALDTPLHLDESALLKSQPGRSQEVVPVSLMSAPALPRLEQSNDAVLPIRVEVSGSGVAETPTQTAAGKSLSPSLPGEPSGVPNSGPVRPAALDKTMPGSRLGQRSNPPDSPQPQRFEAAGREQGLSLVLSSSPQRAQIQEIERLLSSGQHVAAVRRANNLFVNLSIGDSSRNVQEGPAWRALLLGLPADRYVRFRQVVSTAEQSRSTLEDAWFALFFVVDALLRREAFDSR